MSHLWEKLHQIRFQLRPCPRSHWWSLQRSLYLRIKGGNLPTYKGRNVRGFVPPLFLKSQMFHSTQLRQSCKLTPCIIEGWWLGWQLRSRLQTSFMFTDFKLFSLWRDVSGTRRSGSCSRLSWTAGARSSFAAALNFSSRHPTYTRVRQCQMNVFGKPW